MTKHKQPSSKQVITPETFGAKGNDPLPEGFTRHNGGHPPVQDRARVICAIRTVDGVRLALPGRADNHIWEENLHDDGIGAVVGWKPA